VSLKKPSEVFKKNKGAVSLDETVEKIIKTSDMSTFSDAFNAFKNNLNKIEILSDFSETLDNYRVNIERINHLSEKVEEIKNDISSLLKKEDLENAMMSQLILVEESIRQVQKKVKSINEDELSQIREQVFGLSENVIEFFENEVPKYSKLVVESEIRVNTRYDDLEKSISQSFEEIEEYVENKYGELTENLQTINENSLSGIIQEFNSLDEVVSKIKKEDIPKYKGFIVETERKTETKLEEFDEKLNKTVAEVLGIVKSVETITEETENKVLNRIQEVGKLQEDVTTEIERIENYKEDITKKVANLEVELIRNDKHLKEQNHTLENLQDGIITNGKFIKEQNQTLERIQDELHITIQKLNLEKLEKTNYELTKKVKYLEEIFEKFNEKDILTESIIPEPSSVKNKDPLTPLDKNFVTFEQLQQHYRLYINRIQQQLATIGGGGETRLKYLDDIVGIATNPSAYDGKYLKYSHSLGKFEFQEVSGGIGIGTTTSSLLGVGVTSLLFTGPGISDIIVDDSIVTINIVGQSSQNYDGGNASSLYGGTEPIICGGA
jgi:membrane-associated protease RseP (regulator of RpoE activity)